MFGVSVRRGLVAVVATAVLGGSLVACGDGDGSDVFGAGGNGSATASTGGGGADAPSDAVEEGVVKGHVADSAGRPIKGAEIVVDNQLLYDSNMVLTTDDRGNYRAEMPGIAATYSVTASFRKTYHNITYTFRLAPKNPEAFVGREGAVRDFTWKLTGEQADAPDSFHGGSVLFYLDAVNPVDDSYVDSAGVRLTLTPVGPLVDGSTGKTITKSAENTGDGWGVRDVPVGRYTISATLTGESGRTQPLRVRLRDGDRPAAAEVTADFAPYLTDLQRIELELEL